MIRSPACRSVAFAIVVFAHSTLVHANDLFISDVTVVSPERLTPSGRTNVHIHNGRIARISPDPPNSRDDIRLIDGRGLYLTPGLMDSHVHTPMIPGMGVRGEPRVKKYAELATLFEQQQARSLLYFGITQIVDPALHPDKEFSDGFYSSTIKPDLFHCGAAPLSNGYPTMHMDRRVIASAFPYRIYQDADAARADGAAPAMHTPEVVVQRMHDDGAICVKLFFEDGWGLRNDWPMLSQSQLKRVIDAAKQSGLKVMAHANAIDMQQQAVAAGVDVLAHGLWNWNQYKDSTGVPDGIREHLDNIRSGGVAYQPTLRLMHGMQEMFTPSAMYNPALKKAVPPKLLSWYRTPAAQSFKTSLAKDDFDNLPEPRIAELITNGPLNRGQRALRYLADTDHQPLLLASDQPGTPGHINHPGLSSYQELTHMVEAGVSLKTIFEAATINNANVFGLADRYGSVEVGKVANLLLLEANPLETADAYAKIKWIILNGALIERESLAADRQAANGDQ